MLCRSRKVLPFGLAVSGSPVELELVRRER
jgi:hypothetical protein